MSLELKIILSALGIVTLVSVVWLLAMLRDGRRLRREADEWRRDLARQREIHAEDDSSTVTLPTLPGAGA